MAKKPTITNISSGYTSTTTLNNNFQALRDAFDNTLSLDGSTPNSMNADLDMNSNDILNAQTVDTEALRIGGVLVTASGLNASGATLNSDNYTGNGVTTSYTMSYQPFIKDNTQVYIDGVYQNKDGYSISGTTLAFSEAPPLNSKIEIVVARSLDVAATDAANVGYTQGGTGSTNRTVEAKLQEFVSVKDFGAIGDGVTDDTAAFQAAVDDARAGSGIIYIPPGDYYLTSGISAGASIGVIGSGRIATTLILDFPTEQWLFDFNTQVSWKPVRSFTVLGQTQYGGNEKFFNNSTAAYTTVIEDVTFSNLKAGINLVNAWSCYLQNLRGSYVTDPIVMTIANGSVVRDIYIQRYIGSGLKLVDALAPQVRNVIFEYGFGGIGDAPGGQAIQLQATQSASIDGLYTEGGKAADVLLTFKNQRRCLNTQIRSCWLNSGGTKSIVANSYSGLEVSDIVYQTPQCSEVFDFSTRSSGSEDPIYVGPICQVDQNANGFVNDVRGSGQTLIPLSTSDNRRFIVTKPNPRVGNGTDSDLSNIANHTQPDSSGRLPFIASGGVLSAASAPGDLTATSSSTQSVYGPESSGITIYAQDYGCIELWVTGVITSSVGSPTFTNFRLTNSTTGDDLETGVINTGASGATYTKTLLVNVQPGANEITLAVTREQGGGGTNTYTVSDMLIVKKG